MAVNYAETPRLLGLIPADLDALLSGEIYASVAARLGVSMGDAEDFIAGSVSHAMARQLGFQVQAAAEEFARALGREGRIGFLVGVLLPS